MRYYFRVLIERFVIVFLVLRLKNWYCFILKFEISLIFGMVLIKVLVICLLCFDIKESYELDFCFIRVLRKSR